MSHKQPTGSFAAESLLGQMRAAGIGVIFANGSTDFPRSLKQLRLAESGIAMPEPLTLPHERVAVGMVHDYYLGLS